MNAETQSHAPPVVVSLRSATHEIHKRIESRLDIVARLSDPALRQDMIRRFAALHLPAHDVLAPHLTNISGLNFPGRIRELLLNVCSGKEFFPAFPQAASGAEALGMLYVLHGSMLGGRLITHALSERGIIDPDLAFLDPYGPSTGARWRDFISVLAREIGQVQESIGAACKGAQSAFLHSEQLLCDAERRYRPLRQEN